ncbi:MAG: undecaprenyldiphospho-muramoylpentapeptide beta-N-acetylglucosaminyltransferase [Candidatus Omnitrophica bacterium]|nr:undecaprenyldiphospho-muramoylpentapeptide beta-N-acetylglucosaminyltransferase [Candidatus Omnitrophota bacterium]
MKIVMAAGGTAGHMFPALEVARNLRREGHEIMFIGVFKSSKRQLEDEGFAFKQLGAKGLQCQGWIQDMFAVVSLVRTAFQARSLIKLLTPDVVVGFGGYGSFPAVCGGLMGGVPVIIHEQNVMPGRANRLLARFVKKVAISFPESRSFLSSDKVIITGCPIISKPSQGDSRLLRKAFNFSADRKTILVFGGSQGSRRINGVFPQCINMLSARLPIQVIHVSGRGALAELQKIYQAIDVPYRLFENYRPMAELYGLADVVVCRAGAATVTELVLFQKPAVLIPYPFAHGHQAHNANVLVENQVARMIPDGQVTPEALAAAVTALLEHPPQCEKFSTLNSRLNIDHATGDLTREILTTV